MQWTFLPNLVPIGLVVSEKKTKITDTFGPLVFFVVYFRSTNKLFLEDHPMNIHSKFGFNWFGDFREEDKNVQVYWQKKSRLQVMTLPHTTLLIRWAKNIDWVAQTSIIYKCQLKLYWHLNLFKMYMTLIYTQGLIDICATQSLPKTNRKCSTYKMQKSPFLVGPLWSWSYGSWIYNYLCNRCFTTNIVSLNLTQARCTWYNLMW
jgi:hypothetical protein